MAKRHTSILIAYGLNVRRGRRAAYDAQMQARLALQLQQERDALRRAMARLRAKEMRQ